MLRVLRGKTNTSSTAKSRRAQAASGRKQSGLALVATNLSKQQCCKVAAEQWSRSRPACGQLCHIIDLKWRTWRAMNSPRLSPLAAFYCTYTGSRQKRIWSSIAAIRYAPAPGRLPIHHLHRHLDLHPWTYQDARGTMYNTTIKGQAPPRRRYRNETKNKKRKKINGKLKNVK